MTLPDLIEMGLERNADEVVLVDQFPIRTALEVRMNPEIEGDTQMLPVAELSLEDSGYAQLLWAIGIETLKAARAAQQ